MLKVASKNTRRWFLTVLSLLASPPVFLWSASAPSAHVEQTVVLMDVRLINGAGGSPLEQLHSAAVRCMFLMRASVYRRQPPETTTAPEVTSEGRMKSPQWRQHS